MSPASRFAFADILQILDALPVGVLMVSPEGLVLHLNRPLSTLTGFAPDEVRGVPCRHVLRGRQCVSGCPLGCGSFGSGLPSSVTASRPGSGLDLEELGRDGKNLASSLANGSVTAPGAGSAVETDILTLKKRKVPVRLTHFPVMSRDDGELFRLDVIEDLTEVKLMERRLHQASGQGRMIGRSEAMEKIMAIIPSVACSNAPVLLTGETGTGKDILAETVHQASKRSREAFVRLNVSPLPEDLLASEIFGSASPEGPERPGRFQQASGGTLYITELADMPPGIQARLVQFLETGTILPVGAVRESSPDVRLITASNRDPAELVASGILSGELFHRLNVVHIPIPPLRERREDIDFLLRHFLELFAARFKKRLSGFSPEARALLSDYPYPGNVRELRNIVEYAAMVCPGEEIGVPCLPALVAAGASTLGTPGAPASEPKKRQSRPRARQGSDL